MAAASTSPAPSLALRRQRQWVPKSMNMTTSAIAFLALVFVLGQVSLLSVRMTRYVLSVTPSDSKSVVSALYDLPTKEKFSSLRKVDKINGSDLASPDPSNKEQETTKKSTTTTAGAGEKSEAQESQKIRHINITTLAMLPWSLRLDDFDDVERNKSGYFYRGMVMRFVAFIAHARREGHDQILLPTLLWSARAQGDDMADQIPMEIMFDIQHWNDVAEKRYRDLPRIVDHLEEDGDCWNRGVGESKGDDSDAATIKADLESQKLESSSLALSTTLLKGLDLNDQPSKVGGNNDSPLKSLILGRSSFPKPLDRLVRAVISKKVKIGGNIGAEKSIDLMPLISHCTHPFVYGGSYKLAKEYMNLPQPPPPEDSTDEVDIDFTSKLLHHTLQALRPNKVILEVVDACLEAQKANSLFISVAHEGMQGLAHGLMEKYNKNAGTGSNKRPSLDTVFVANSNATTSHSKSSSPNTNVTSDANPPTGAKTSILTCGERWVDEWKQRKQSEGQNNLDADIFAAISIPTPLLAQVVDFEIATHRAAVAIGTPSDRWSYDVWLTRYFHGKGLANFYGAQGGSLMLPIPNDGRPPGMGPLPGEVSRPAKSQWIEKN